MDNKNAFDIHEVAKLLQVNSSGDISKLDKLKRLLPLETISGELISAYCLVLSGLYILVNSSLLADFNMNNHVSIFVILFMLGLMHVFAIVYEPPTHYLRIVCLIIELFLWMFISIKLGGLLSIIFSSIGMMIGWALIVQLVLKKEIMDEIDHGYNN